MKKLEYIFMFLAVLSTLASISVNIKSGFIAYSWQLATLVWIGVAYIKTERIKSLERKIDDSGPKVF